MKKSLFLFFFSLSALLFSQNETTKWYFGAQAGLDFMTSPPTILTNGAMTTQEGCATISSGSGNLLFYTDGITIWNQLHLPMANGTGLLGNGSSTQSGVIVKQPGNNPLYIVFTLDAFAGANGLRYSVVDLSLASGNGSVTTKNVLLQTPSTEKLTAVRHCNGIDVWVVSHDNNSNNFRTFLVTSAGVNSTPVNSAVGTIHLNMLGSLKASGNGRKLGLTIYTTNNTAEVYDFDNSTGVVSNPIVLGSSFYLLYGCEFSPDGKIFYACNATATNTGSIYQWNLCAGSSTAIIASQVTVFTSTNSLGAMQLAPNGKIYVSRYLTSTLGLINSPNILGTSCNYVDLAQSVSPKICRFGLPNFVTSFLKGPSPPYTYTFNPLVSCLNASFTAPPTATCGSSGYTVTGYSWSFGDPLSGGANTSFISSPTHSFTAPGSYSTQLILFYTCGTDTLRQTVVVPSPTITIGNTSINCSSPGSATVFLSGGTAPYTYTWLPTNQSTSVVSVSTPGTYSVLVAGSGQGCNYSATTSIVGFNYFVFSTTTSSPVCFGSSTGSAVVTTTGSAGPFSYSWTGTSQTSSSVSGLSSGMYTVTVTDLNTFCSLSQTFQINQPPPLTLTTTVNSPTVCPGIPVTFTATCSGGSPPYSYSWFSGPSTVTYQVSNFPPGTHIYTATAIDSQSCLISSSGSYTVISNPVIISASISICSGSIGTLAASGATSYTWYPSGSIGNTFTASPTVFSNYTVLGMSAGCSSSIMTTIDIKPFPTLSFNTFSITCGSLGSATLNSLGGTGPFSYTWTPTGQTNIVATGLFPGSYTLTVLDIGTGCVYTPTTSFAPLVPLTGTVSATNSLICNSVNTGTATIALSGGSGTQTYLWTSTNGVQTNSFGSGLAAGINTVLVSDALTFCSVTHTFLITQPPAFTLNIASSSPSVCMGDSISLSATNFGGTPAYTYTWTGQGPGNNLIVKENLSGSYIYTVSSSDLYDCLVTKTISVLFVPNPTISVSSASICPLGLATLSASGASSYTWNTGTSSNVLVVSPPGTTNYTVRGSALSCTSMATARVYLYSPPTPSIISNSPVCQGDSLTLQAIGGVLYLWNGPLNFTSTSTAFTFLLAAPSKSGNYSLKVFSVEGCSASITSSITVNPQPLVVASAGTVCEGASLNLYSNYTSGSSHQWTGPSFSSPFQNPVIFGASVANSGTYSVILTSAAGCTNMASATASVVHPPPISILGDTAVCIGRPIQFFGSGGGTYSWNGPNSFYSVVQNPSISAASIASGGLYSLLVNFGPCQQSTNLQLIVYPLPIPVVQNNSPVCEKTPILLNASSAQSYTWSGPAGYSFPGQTAVIASASLINSGTYTISVTDINSCIGNSIVLVNVLPAPLLAAGDATVCLGSTLTLSVSGTGNSYLWSGPLNYTASGTQVIIPLVKNNNTGVYTVVAMGSNSCSTTSTILVIGFAFNLPLPIISAPAKSCVGSSITLSASDAILYEWWGPSGFYSNQKEVPVFVKDLSMAGIYTLSVKNASFCAASATVLLNVFPLPTGALTASQNEMCVPFCSVLQVAATGNTGPLVSSIFSFDGEIFNGLLYKPCFLEAGGYSIHVSFRDSNNCVNTSTLLIKAYEKPRAGFDYTPTNPLAGIDLLHFYNTSTGTALNSYTWFLNGTDTVFMNEKDPVYMYPQAGLYPVVLIVKNSWGCMDTLIKPILIEDNFNLYIPDAFTPNGDGLNDVFIPKGQGIRNYYLQIFDRWGEVIFHTSDLNTGWDGSRKGNRCQVDSYVWRIELSGNNGKTKVLTGHVLLTH